jgi:hypothetical protein
MGLEFAQRRIVEPLELGHPNDRRGSRREGSRAVTRLIALSAALWLCGCDRDGGSGSSGGGGAATGLTTDAWIIEPGIRILQATSSCTIRLPDNSFRLYLAGITTASSTDGLTWSGTSSVGLSGAPGEFLRNPAVLQESDGTILMIYEGVTNNTNMRFYRATSTNGTTFTNTPGPLAGGAVMLPEPDENNFISVPELIRLDAATRRIYFVAGGDHVESAISMDGGFNWVREGDIGLNGLPAGQVVVDPDIVRLSDGQFRLFFATPPDGVPGLANKRIRSGLSVDGIGFVLEAGDRVGVDDSTQDRLDPDVVLLVDGRYRMYFGEAPFSGGVYDLRSALSP